MTTKVKMEKYAENCAEESAIPATGPRFGVWGEDSYFDFHLKSVASVSDTGGKNPEALIVLRKESQ